MANEKELIIRGLLELDLDQDKVDKKITALAARMREQLKKSGTIDINAVLGKGSLKGLEGIKAKIDSYMTTTGESPLAERLNNIQVAASELKRKFKGLNFDIPDDLGAKAVNDMLRLGNAIDQVVRKSEALAGLKLAPKQIALLRDLAGTGPNGLVTVDEYAGKSRAKRAFAESTIATAQRISELTRGISNTLAAQPELREYGIAAAAATKELNDLAKATAKATDVTSNEIKDREKSRREYKALDKKRQQRSEKLAQVEERLEASRARVSPLLSKTPQELTATQAVDVKEFLTLAAKRSQMLHDQNVADYGKKSYGTEKSRAEFLRDQNALRDVNARIRDDAAERKRREAAVSQRAVDEAKQAKADARRREIERAGEEANAARLTAENSREARARLRAERKAQERLAKKAQADAKFESLQSRARELSQIPYKDLTSAQIKDQKEFLLAARERANIAYGQAVAGTKGRDTPQALAAKITLDQASRNIQRFSDEVAEATKVVKPSPAAKAAADAQGRRAERDRLEARAISAGMERTDPRRVAPVSNATFRDIANLQKFDIAETERRRDAAALKDATSPEAKAESALLTKQRNELDKLNAEREQEIKNFREAQAQKRKDAAEQKAAATRAAAEQRAAATRAAAEQKAAATAAGRDARRDAVIGLRQQRYDADIAAARASGSGLDFGQYRNAEKLFTDLNKRASENYQRVVTAGGGKTDTPEARAAHAEVARTLRELEQLQAARRAETAAIDGTEKALKNKLVRQLDQVRRGEEAYDRTKDLTSPIFAKQGLQPGDLRNVDFSKLTAREGAEVEKLARQYQRLLDLRKELARTASTAPASVVRDARTAAAGGGGGGKPPLYVPQIDGMDDANRRLDEHASVLRRVHAAAAELETPLGQVGRLFNQFFRYALGYGALYQVLNFFRFMAVGVADLNKELYSIQAVAGVTAREMQGVGAAIKAVALSTKFSVTEIALAAKTLVQAGVETDALPKVLQATARFAAAADSDISTAADLISTVRDVYSELDDNTIANQLTRAVNISKLTAEDLRTILSLGAQTAQGFNLTSEQYLAAVSTLRNAGIKASTVATGLRQAMLEIFNPDEKTLKAFKDRYEQMGENISQEEIRSRFYSFKYADNPLAAGVAELKRLGFGGESQKTLQRVFDVRAVNAIQALISNFNELEAASSRITFGEAAAEASDVQMRSLANSVTNLGAALTVFSAEIMSGPVESLEALADKATKAIQKLTDLDIKLKAGGERGLAGIAGPAGVTALAGGIIGGRMRHGIGGAVAGTMAGLALGGTADLLAQQEKVEGERSVAATAAEAASSAAVIYATYGLVAGFLVKLAAGWKKAAGFFKVAAVAVGPVMPLGTKILRLFSLTAPGRVFKLVVVGLTALAAAVEYLGLVEKLFPRSEVDRVNDVLDSARKKAGKSTETRQALEDSARQYAVNDAAEPGTAGYSANRLGELLKKTKLNSFKLFGQVPVETGEAINQLLERYLDASSEERDRIIAKLKELSPTLAGNGSDALGFEINQLAQSRSELEQASTALIKDMSAAMEKAGEVVNDPDADPTSREFKREQAKLSAYLKLSAEVAAEQQADSSLPSLDAILFGLREVSAEVRERYIRRWVQYTGDFMSEGMDAALAEEAADKQAVVEAAIAKAIVDSKGDPQKLQVALSGIYAGMNSLTENARERLDALAAALRAAAAQLEAGTVTPGEFVSIPDGLGGQTSVFVEGTTTPPSAADLQQAAGLRQAAGTVDAKSEAVRQAQEEAAEAVREGYRQTLRDAFDLRNDDDFKAGLEMARASDPAAALRVEKLLEQASRNSTPEQIDVLVSTETDQASIDRGAPEKPVLVDDSAANVRFIQNARQAGEDLNQSAEQRAREAAAIGLAGVYQEREELDARIKRLQKGGRGYVSEDYAELTTEGPDNLYRRQAALTKFINAYKIGELERQIEENGKGREAAEKNLSLYEQRAKLVGETAALDEDANEAILAANETVERINIQRLEQFSQLQKQNAELDIGDAGVAGGGVDAFFANLQKIDEANDDLLAGYRRQAELLAQSGEFTAADLAERERLLRDLIQNREEFKRLLDVLGAARLEMAAALAASPLTTGDANLDARLERVGATPTDEARLGKNRAEYRGAGLERSVAAERLAIAQARAANPTLQGQEKYLADVDVLAAKNALITADQRLAALQLEAIQITNDMGDEVREAFDLDTLVGKLRSSAYAVELLGEALQDNFVSAVDSLADVLAQAVEETGNLKEGLRAWLHEWAMNNLRSMIGTALNSVLTQVLDGVKGGKAAPEGAGGVITKVGGWIGDVLGIGKDENGKERTGGALAKPVDWLQKIFGFGKDDGLEEIDLGSIPAKLPESGVPLPTSPEQAAQVQQTAAQMQQEAAQMQLEAANAPPQCCPEGGGAAASTPGTDVLGAAADKIGGAAGDLKKTSVVLGSVTQALKAGASAAMAQANISREQTVTSIITDKLVEAGMSYAMNAAGSYVGGKIEGTATTWGVGEGIPGTTPDGPTTSGPTNLPTPAGARGSVTVLRPGDEDYIPGYATGVVFDQGAGLKDSLIQGPGTGTSDSILAVGPAGPIKVANGESILNQPATALLGADFINGLNKSAMRGYAAGGVVGDAQAQIGKAAPAPGLATAPSQAAPKVEMTTINAIDSPSVLQSALNSPAGTKTILNFMRANKGRINTTLNS